MIRRIDVSQDTFPDSQNKKTLHYGALDAKVADFLTYLFAADSDSVSHSWIWRKRRFRHTQEKLCEKNDAATQATSAVNAKRYVRKPVRLNVRHQATTTRKGF